MATMTIRIPDAKRNRLRRLAQYHGISVNKLVEEWASVALAQFDAEIRFKARAARGEARRGLELLDKMDKVAASRGTPGGRRSRKIRD